MVKLLPVFSSFYPRLHCPVKMNFKTVPFAEVLRMWYSIALPEKDKASIPEIENEKD